VWIVEEICIPRGDAGRLVMGNETAETQYVWVDALRPPCVYGLKNGRVSISLSNIGPVGQDVG
jgi:hypothetical protein